MTLPKTITDAIDALLHRALKTLTSAYAMPADEYLRICTEHDRAALEAAIAKEIQPVEPPTDAEVEAWVAFATSWSIDAGSSANQSLDPQPDNVGGNEELFALQRREIREAVALMRRARATGSLERGRQERMGQAMTADRTVYTDTREGGDVRCFFCHQPVGGLHELDCPVFKDCDVTVTLRRTSDGVTRKWTEARNSLCDPRYWWEEGNGSCDCNRTIYFARAIWAFTSSQRSEGRPATATWVVPTTGRPRAWAMPGRIAEVVQPVSTIAVTGRRRVPVGCARWSGRWQRPERRGPETPLSVTPSSRFFIVLRPSVQDAAGSSRSAPRLGVDRWSVSTYLPNP